MNQRGRAILEHFDDISDALLHDGDLGLITDLDISVPVTTTVITNGSTNG